MGKIATTFKFAAYTKNTVFHVRIDDYDYRRVFVGPEKASSLVRGYTQRGG